MKTYKLLLIAFLLPLITVAQRPTQAAIERTQAAKDAMQATATMGDTTKKATDVDELIERFLEAANANDTLAYINAFKYNRSYVANANTDYDEEVVVVVDKNQLSRKKTLLKRDFFYVLNDKEGWVKIPMGSLDKKPTYSVKELSKKEIGELSSEAGDGLFPFVDFEEKGYKLKEPISKTTLANNKAVTKLEIIKDEIHRVYYFDDKTGLVEREVWIENGITHTLDHLKYDKTKVGILLPVSSSYIDSKAKKKNKVTTEWIFDNPTKGVVFTK